MRTIVEPVHFDGVKFPVSDFLSGLTFERELPGFADLEGVVVSVDLEHNQLVFGPLKSPSTTFFGKWDGWGVEFLKDATVLASANTYMRFDECHIPWEEFRRVIREGANTFSIKKLSSKEIAQQRRNS